MSPQEALSPVPLPAVYAVAFGLVGCLVLGAAWATVWGPVKPGSGWGALGYRDTGVPHVAMARGLGLPGEAGPLPDTWSPLCRWLDGGERRVPAATTTPKAPKPPLPSGDGIWGTHVRMSSCHQKDRGHILFELDKI